MSPKALDRAIVLRHLAALHDAVARLRPHAAKPRAALDDGDQRWLVERGLMVCAQNALDVAAHLAASMGRDALDYRSAIDRLTDGGVLPTEFGHAFRDVAGFRNALVHAYLEVDLDIVHDILTRRLDSFDTFAEHVVAWLDSGET